MFEWFLVFIVLHSMYRLYMLKEENCSRELSHECVILDGRKCL